MDALVNNSGSRDLLLISKYNFVYGDQTCMQSYTDNTITLVPSYDNIIILIFALITMLLFTKFQMQTRCDCCVKFI